MRALQFTAYGGPEVLTWGDAPVPHAGPGQIRIAVRAASVNPVDWKVLAGAMSGGQPLAGPGYLGRDAAGVVDQVGEGVVGVSIGAEVFGRGQNTQAESAVLDSWAAKPSSMDWAVAAAAGVAGETSERGLRLLGIKAGDTIFVDGGAGGVGAVAVQMAEARGARVIASASEANQGYLREIEAIPVLYGEGVAAGVRAAAGGRVDAVFACLDKRYPPYGWLLNRVAPVRGRPCGVETRPAQLCAMTRTPLRRRVAGDQAARPICGPITLSDWRLSTVPAQVPASFGARK